MIKAIRLPVCVYCFVVIPAKAGIHACISAGERTSHFLAVPGHTPATAAAFAGVCPSNIIPACGRQVGNQRPRNPRKRGYVVNG